MSTVDRDVVRGLKAREDERFRDAHPRSIELLKRASESMPDGVPMAWLADPGTYDHPPMWVTEGKGSRFRCVDGHEYVDFNVADMSMFCGYAPEPVVEAVSRRVAAGNQFLLPVEDSIWVAEELARRWMLPKWQFTLSASQANTELIRVARVATGRPKVLMFEGKYHGHFDQALVTLKDGREVPEELGLPPDVTEQTRVIPFNDLEAVARALEPREVAVVLLEPAMTNNQGLILPQPGFHEELRRITRETGTVLAYDETHTLVCGPGGLTRTWNLEPDAVSLGKSIAAGVPIGAYGMTEELASVFAFPDPRRGRACAARRGHRRDAVRERVDRGGGPSRLGRGADGGRLRAHGEARNLAGRRDGSGRPGCGPTVDHPPVLPPVGLHDRSAVAPQRLRGARVRGSPARALDPRLPGQPRGVGGHPRRRADGAGPGDRGRR
jgi:hypothetical protein